MGYAHVGIPGVCGHLFVSLCDALNERHPLSSFIYSGLFCRMDVNVWLHKRNGTLSV